MLNKKLLLALALLIFPFCAKKTHNHVNTSIFIEMPRNLTVFENIAPMIYDVTWEHFQTVGFDLAYNQNSEFKLSTDIRALEYPEQFISPDLLPYMFKVKMELECKLFRLDKLIVTKTFKFFKWINRPKNPIFNWTYIEDQYKTMFEDSVARIDQFFRPYLIKKKSVFDLYQEQEK